MKKKKDRKLPLISVIILNFNGKSYLERTIPPILELRYPRYEIVVVDNGSEDGSLEYIQSLGPIRLLRSPRYREKNYACNYAIRESRGDYILLLDCDIILVDMELLSKLYRFHQSLENPGAVGLAVHDEGFTGSSRYGTYFGRYFIREVRKLPLGEIRQMHSSLIPATGGQIFIRKDLWEEIGGYDEALVFGGDDNDLGIRLTLMGYRNHLYSESSQIHIGLMERLDNEKYRRRFAETFYAHLHTITKNYGKTNLLPSLFIYTAFTFLKAIKQSLQRKNSGPLLSFFRGLLLYFRNLGTSLEKREQIQESRLIRNDLFMEIKPLKPGKTF